jgi:hypothetical protein
MVHSIKDPNLPSLVKRYMERLKLKKTTLDASDLTENSRGEVVSKRRMQQAMSNFGVSGSKAKKHSSGGRSRSSKDLPTLEARKMKKKKSKKSKSKKSKSKKSKKSRHSRTE